MSGKLTITADTTAYRQAVKGAEEEGKRSLASIATGIRRTAEIGLFFAQAAGVAIDQILQLYIETGLRAIEFTAALAAGLTAGTLGLNIATGQLAAQGIAIIAMFAQINALRHQKVENAQRIGLATSGLRALTFQVLFVPIMMLKLLPFVVGGLLFAFYLYSFHDKEPEPKENRWLL